jgi:putative ABC transport system ATP-binding protein
MIVCENLVKIYSLSGVEVVALQGLDLSVQDGEILGIVGASGSGKSTLLNVLGGLDRPSAGRVLVGERDLLKMSDAELDVYRRTQVGFVWQQTTRNLVPYLSALENVELPMRLTGLSHGKRRRHARELLETLGLAERLRHHPAQLSGGEQQRVSIAVALANHPQILLADEPTGEVDTATAQEIYAALRKVNQAYGMTVLIVSHDLHIGRYTDRVVAIRDGKTSTETVRAGSASSSHLTDGAHLEIHHPEHPKAHEYEELVVLDGAGRLQIPRDYLEALDIGDRVRLELKGADIIIHSVAGRGRTTTVESALPSPDELYIEEDRAPEKKPRTWIGRLRRNRKSPSRGGETPHEMKL